jgi:citrate synthase
LSDLMKLRQSSRGFKKEKAPDAAVWMGPVIKSAITEIRNDGHRYRGHNAIKLAMADKPFEDVVELLWETGQDGQTAWRKVKPFAIPKQLRALASSEVDYLDLLKLLFVMTELGDALSRKLNAEDIFITARRLILTMSTTPGIEDNRDTYYSNGAFPIAQTLLSALSLNKGRDRDRIRHVNCALVLCADHELNASALAARVAASCDASLYSLALCMAPPADESKI